MYRSGGDGGNGIGTPHRQELANARPLYKNYAIILLKIMLQQDNLFYIDIHKDLFACWRFNPCKKHDVEDFTPYT